MPRHNSEFLSFSQYTESPQFACLHLWIHRVTSGVRTVSEDCLVVLFLTPSHFESSDSFSLFSHDMSTQTTIAPFDQSVVCKKQLLSEAELSSAIDAAAKTQKAWAKVPVEDRVAIITKWMEILDAEKQELGKELSAQMGRPVGQCAGEIKGALQRCRYLCKVAKDALADLPRTDTETPNLKLAIRRDPFGVVAIVTPWK